MTLLRVDKIVVKARSTLTTPHDTHKFNNKNLIDQQSYTEEKNSSREKAATYAK